MEKGDDGSAPDKARVDGVGALGLCKEAVVKGDEGLDENGLDGLGGEGRAVGQEGIGEYRGVVLGTVDGYFAPPVPVEYTKECRVGIPVEVEDVDMCVCFKKEECVC